jgi:hypothetical protein
MDKYTQLLSSQPHVTNQDFRVRVVDNVLLAEHIDEIYRVINNTSDSNTRVQPWAGHKVWDVKFSKEIEKRITSIAQAEIGDHVELDFDYSFARYSPKFGYKCKLFPHYDTRDSQRVTFDIQLRASEPWSVVVENIPYPLKDNQALMFAGTQQIHWRENKDIDAEAEIDMIFCHLTYKEPRPLDNNQKQILDRRATMLIEETGISNEVVKNEI